MARSFQDDYLRGLGTGGTLLASTPVLRRVAQVAHGFVPTSAVYLNSATGQWTAAIASASTTLGWWIVVEVTDNDNFVVAMAGQHTVTSHGLNAGQLYYVSSTVAGALTNVRPTPSATAIINPIVYVATTNIIYVLPYEAGQEELIMTMTPFIRSGENETMYLIMNTPFPFNVIDVNYTCTAGTIDMDFRIDNVNITGMSGLTCNNTNQTATATALNMAVIGRDLTIVFTNATSATNMRMTIKYIRNSVL